MAENVVPPPYETYKGIHLYVTQDASDVQVHFDWYGRIQFTPEEEWEKPTLENKLRETRLLIDLLLDLKEQGCVDDKGHIKKASRM